MKNANVMSATNLFKTGAGPGPGCKSGIAHLTNTRAYALRRRSVPHNHSPQFPVGKVASDPLKELSRNAECLSFSERSPEGDLVECSCDVNRKNSHATSVVKCSCPFKLKGRKGDRSCLV